MSPGRRRILLLLLAAASVINYADRQIIAVLKPMLATSLHWSDQDYGLLTSAFQLAAAAAYLFAGDIIDRVGLKRAYPLGVAAWSLAAMGHAVVRTFAQFCVVRLALGAAETINTPAAVKAAQTFWNEAERPAAMGLLNAANNVGAIVTPLFVPLLALSFGWRAAFVAMGALGLIWAVVWWPLVGHGSGVDQADASRLAAGGGGWGAALRDRRSWAIMGAKALSDQVWWFLLFWTPDLLHRTFHLGLAQSAGPLAVIYACAALGAYAGGWVSGWLSRAGAGLDLARKGVLLGCALLVTPVWLALYVSSAWAAVGLMGLALFAHQGFSTTLFTVMADIVPAARLGRVTSLGAFAGNLAGMAVLAIVGLSLSHGGGYLPFLVLAASAYLLALGWLHLLMPRLSPAAPTSGPSADLAHA